MLFLKETSLLSGVHENKPGLNGYPIIKASILRRYEDCFTFYFAILPIKWHTITLPFAAAEVETKAGKTVGEPVNQRYYGAGTNPQSYIQ